VKKRSKLLLRRMDNKSGHIESIKVSTIVVDVLQAVVFLDLSIVAKGSGITRILSKLAAKSAVKTKV
jgi:hypothetical protein